MNRIFEKPISYNGVGGNLVLFFGDYIICNIAKNTVEVIIKDITEDKFNPLEFDLIIDVKFISKYEFEPGNDSDITFTMLNTDDKSAKKVSFQNVEEANKAEKTFAEQSINLGFERQEIQLTPWQAAKSPGKMTLTIAVIGTLATIYAYGCMNEQPSEQRVRWYVLLFRKFAESVGYVLFLIITAVLVCAGLFWTIKRMATPPFKIIGTKLK